MRIVVPKEIVPGERRVALTPDAAGRLVKAGHEVAIEHGAGEGASFLDSAYEAAGARIVPDPATLYGNADLILKVQKPQMNAALGKHEVALMRPGAVLVAFLAPLLNPDLVRMLQAQNITSFSMDAIPRISRAQTMDALSSQATIAGYKAVLLGADTLGKIFPLLMTAAGTIAPARVFVLGAGVAGLQAIATARRLGAVVEAFDVRPVVKEQVESLGAKFVMLEQKIEAAGSGGYAKELTEEQHRLEVEMLAKHAKDSDVVITTAAIPGRKAPVLITADMVRRHAPRQRHRGPGRRDGRQLRADAGGADHHGERRHHHGPGEPAEHDPGAREPDVRQEHRELARAADAEAGNGAQLG